MHKRSLRIEVDDDTYSILKAQQRFYFDAKRRKLSFANIILHYFFQGFDNSNKQIENGLSIIEGSESAFQNVNGILNKKQEKVDSVRDLKSELKKRKESIEQNEWKLWQRENSLVRKELELKRSVVSARQASVFELKNSELTSSNVELVELINEIKLLKKNSFSGKYENEFHQILSKLDKIDSQTKKTTMDIILQFASPLISIVGFFLITKKLDSNMSGIKPVIQELKSIYLKLNEKEKELMSEQIDFNLDDLL